MKLPDRNKTIHILFDIALVAKAVDGVVEIIGGFLAFFVNVGQIHSLVRWLTADELAEDPTDFIANHLLHASQHLSFSTKLFAAIFLLWHGVVKVGLVWALLCKHLWAYPLAIIAFTLFVAYQMYRYAHTYSAWLLALSVLDTFVILITWLEYKRLRASIQARASGGWQ